MRTLVAMCQNGPPWRPPTPLSLEFILLSAYTDTTGLNTLLNAKQDTLTAGNNITISGSTISATATSGGNSLILQLDGVT